MLRRGSIGTVKLTIPADRFGGLAAALPHGLRPGSSLLLDGPLGGGVSRFCYELLAWWSLSYGFCALVDLTGRVSPAAIASSGADLCRLVVVRPPSRHLDRLASALGALIDGFPFTAVMSDPEGIDGWVIRKAAARASARRAIALFATVGGRAGSEPASIALTLCCRGWSTDPYGVLRERHIEVGVREHGVAREVLLVERAGSPRLLVSGGRGGVPTPKKPAGRGALGSGGCDRYEYPEVAPHGA